MKWRFNEGAVIFLAIAGTLLAFAGYWANFEHDFVTRAVHAEAIIEADPHTGAGTSLVFTTSAGEPVTAYLGQHQSRTVGEHVQVLYTSDRPQATVKIDSVSSLYWIPLTASAFAAVFLVVALVGARCGGLKLRGFGMR